MRVLIAKTKRGDVQITDVPNEQHTLQEIVEGHIEFVSVPGLREYDIGLICNEEGIIKQLPINQNLDPFLYAGNVFFVGLDDDFTDLTDEQIERIKAYFHISI